MKQYKSILLLLLLSASIIIGATLYFHRENDFRGFKIEEQRDKNERIYQEKLRKELQKRKIVLGENPENMSYFIENKEIALTNGVQTITKNGQTEEYSILLKTTGDITGNKNEDVALILEQKIKGNHSNYFITIAYKTKFNLYQGTNALLLDSTEAPESIQIEKKKINVQIGETMYSFFFNGKDLILQKEKN